MTKLNEFQFLSCVFRMELFDKNPNCFSRQHTSIYGRISFSQLAYNRPCPKFHVNNERRNRLQFPNLPKIRSLHVSFSRPYIIYVCCCVVFISFYFLHFSALNICYFDSICSAVFADLPLFDATDECDDNDSSVVCYFFLFTFQSVVCGPLCF